MNHCPNLCRGLASKRLFPPIFWTTHRIEITSVPTKRKPYETDGALMFDFLFPNHPFGGHTLRLVAQAQQGGADVFDIARAMKKGEAGDKNTWEREWLRLAEKTETRARAALAAGHERTARQNFFHASNYYRMSDVLLTIAEETIRGERFRKAQEMLRAAGKLNPTTIY